MHTATHIPADADDRPVPLWRRAVLLCSAVPVGLVLLGLVMVYVALGTIPLGKLFLLLGGEQWAPGTTLRHLPWLDLREAEYYSTPLLSLLLLALVVNMAMATVVRVRWRIEKAGVILTHSGVVVMALGALLGARSSFSGTMILFADEPTRAIAVRDRAEVRWWDGDRSYEVHDRLPRYADFGVAWSERQGRIALDEDRAIIGFGHSARLGVGLEPGDEASAAGWEFVETLATGEQRRVVVRAGDREHEIAALSDGSLLVAVDDGLLGRRSLELFEDGAVVASGGSVLVKLEGGAVVALRATPGATVEAGSDGEPWKFEFLDRVANAERSLAFVSIETEWLGKMLVSIPAWESDAAIRYGDSDLSDSESGIGTEPLPDGLSALFADLARPVVAVGAGGYGISTQNRHERREWGGDDDGQIVEVTPRLRLTLERFLEHSELRQVVHRLDSGDEAQLLNDPRLGSVVRVEDRSGPAPIARWIAFDPDPQITGAPDWLVYRAGLSAVEDSALTMRGFRVELFERGTLPKDFLVDINIETERGEERRQLSLNRPLRLPLRVDGRIRDVQMSLVGWDAEGWEAAAGDGAFDGARYVVLAVTQREGVGAIFAGVVLLLMGMGVSLVRRMAAGVGSLSS